MTDNHFDETQYSLICSGQSFVELPNWGVIEIKGSDRNSFLHNFCTADVKAMQTFSTNEAFILDGRGKILAFGQIVSFPDRLWFLFAGGENASDVYQHLDRYVIRDDVQITDVSESMGVVFVPSVKLIEFGLANVAGESKSCIVDAGDILSAGQVYACSVEWAGDGIALFFENSDFENVRKWLQGKNKAECDIANLNCYRLEQGTPWSGIDIGIENLPQELRRDEKAISFTKGCYLGQETVAKIDAFAHVNKFLVGIAFNSQPIELVLKVGDKKVGDLKSVCFSPALAKWLALAYVKRGFCEPGTQIDSGVISGTVQKMPVTKSVS